MKLLKWGLALVLILGVLLALNWSKIDRLVKVKTLFDADKIVYNFSHMDGALYSDELPRSGPEHVWPVALSPLPESFEFRGQTLDTKSLLEELQTTALVVVKDGTIVFEDYYKGTTPEDRRISWSMSKSFVSALTGLALANGDIESIDDPVTKYVPSLKGSAYDGVPLRHVLNMASGIDFNEDYLDPKSDINKMGTVLGLGGSLDKFAAKQKKIARPSGTAWEYCSIDTHVISMVLRAATGQSLQDYFVENLWSKIGASADAAYSTDGKGNAFALGGLNMRTRDYALFGELMRNHGRRGDVQIIPEDWVEISTRNTAPPATPAAHNTTSDGTPFGYGYQWWMPPNADGEFYAVGVYGQYIYVNPKAGIVIAKNAAQRSFMETDANGDGYMIKNIALFRAIAEHYSDWKMPE
ncbi:MAG TPA: class C beta-lactamase-related serine hydrolase [Hellea balneolensis]|uniref:Class C beta-lactamase-related serine hydrolase n=1 Tax=Hellea balneolensis TaxID=287478 RepID=A0A7C5LVV6_9PROT|nr:class C beta-lactamase-related serine hydrolase [Hellea balneolensis]